jgi:UDP-N-acetylglucosamine/UDP-N-acetylgalactosamine 4-epimerase
MLLKQTYERIRAECRLWVVTGAAGFIGSHLVDQLLALGQRVIGIDNLSSGEKENLREVLKARNFRFVEGDILDLDLLKKEFQDADYVLHQAAIASVTESVRNPKLSTEVNVGGFCNVLAAAKERRVRRLVFASSAAVYGDSETLPKKEESSGSPLSVYALTKQVNEQYAALFHRMHGLDSIALRYFNIYGPRQDPASPYSGVISKFVHQLLNGGPVVIFGDGKASRDFCNVRDVVKANLLAASSSDPRAVNRAFNVGTGLEVSLLELLSAMKVAYEGSTGKKYEAAPDFQKPRAGDILRSLADISAAAEILGYAPEISLQEGLRELVSLQARGG